MTLANVKMSGSDFSMIYRHISGTKYSNMHLRQTKQSGGKRVLRYLHAMCASRTAPEIEGMISGPNVFWHYKLIQAGVGLTQVQVLSHQSTPRDAARLQKRFVKDILDRVAVEQALNIRWKIKRISGQLYLRRSNVGMVASDPLCVSAVLAGRLSQSFVNKLAPWNFRLHVP